MSFLWADATAAAALTAVSASAHVCVRVCVTKREALT